MIVKTASLQHVPASPSASPRARRLHASFRITATPLPHPRPPQGLPLDSDDCTFYALVCEREAGAAAGRVGGAEEDGVLNLWARVAHALYGHNVARALARGQLPDPEEYALVSVGGTILLQKLLLFSLQQ